MPRIATDDDWENDDGADDDEEDNTVPCPHCQNEVYDGAEQCPHCGQYISEEDKPHEKKPGWIVLAGAICLAIVILWVWRG